MTLAQLAPTPVFKAFDNNGNPLAGGLLYTYAAGTNTPQATYPNIIETTPNTNPIVLNFRGECALWLDPTLSYKLNLTDSIGNQISGWPVDNIQGFNVMFNAALTAATIGQILYPQTAAEISANITPVNYQYPAYTPDRYLTNTTPGTTDMWQGITNANTAATVAGASVNFIPGEIYAVNVSAHNAALSMTASWVCNGPYATVRRIDMPVYPATQYFFVVALQVNTLTLRGLIFDGQVTAVSSIPTPNVDIGVIGSFNDNATESLWTQVFGVLFRSTENCTVEDCLFKNFLRAGLRFDTGTSSGPLSPNVTPPIPPYTGTPQLSRFNKAINCKSVRGRGIYGDNFVAIDTENMQWVNCYAYDYERTGWDHDYQFIGSNGTQMVNCVAEYGHDAVTASAQFNCGIYFEAADGASLSSCESKSTSIGFQAGVAANPSQGVWRPYSGAISFKGCNAVRCNSAGFKLELGTRDNHISLVDCFAEVNSQAATYSYSTGIGANAYQLSFIPSSADGAPNGTTQTATKFTMSNCRADMTDMSGVTTAAAFNCYNGAVTNPQQLVVTIDKFSTKWLTSAGVNDTAAITAYESTTAPNYGYFGDIVFSGANNGGSQFEGFAKVINCTNETGGYVMLSSEFSGGNGVLEIVNTRVSMRTGGATSNGSGTLNISNCDLVDMRGQLGWSTVTMNGCFIADADSAHKDRTTWGPGTTYFLISDCYFTRQFLINGSTGSSSSHKVPCAMFTGCTWKMKYQTEAGLDITKTTGDYTSMFMSGCAFIDTGSTSTTNPMIFVSSGDTNFVVIGAGNAFDNNLISGASGHVMTVDATSYDTPQTASGPYVTVFGSVAVPLS